MRRGDKLVPLRMPRRTAEMALQPQQLAVDVVLDQASHRRQLHGADKAAPSLADGLGADGEDDLWWPGAGARGERQGPGRHGAAAAASGGCRRVWWSNGHGHQRTSHAAEAALACGQELARQHRGRANDLPGEGTWRSAGLRFGLGGLGAVLSVVFLPEGAVLVVLPPTISAVRLLLLRRRTRLQGWWRRRPRRQLWYAAIRELGEGETRRRSAERGRQPRCGRRGQERPPIGGSHRRGRPRRDGWRHRRLRGSSLNPTEAAQYLCLSRSQQRRLVLGVAQGRRTCF
mmetsp:Transcript_48247/g.129159  ORF Transcript_48247/g.129159 Transcript_48247/m.129159 type:complete len:287 (-) Transcript_48247:123-983(-)